MFNLKKELGEEEIQIVDIINNYLKKDGIERLISPISDEYFLIDRKREIYICVSHGLITISNHGFLYRKHFNLSFTDVVKKNIRKKLEIERQELKKSLFKNENDLLKRIKEYSAEPDENLV